MWLRNHDNAVESKSVDRFSSAMRSLSRRGGHPRAQAGSRDVLVPGARPAPIVTGGRAPSAIARRERAARQARMRRRRSGLLALVGFVLVLTLAAVVGAASAWLPLVGLVMLAGFGWHLRTVALREARLERRRRRQAAQAPVASDGRPAVRTAAIGSPSGALLAGDLVAPTWPVVAEPVAERRTTADTVVVATADEGWAPTPVVLPTYVTAPPATSVPRVIDLTHPGSWSAAHMLDAAAAAGAADPDGFFDQYEEPAPAPQAAPAAPAEQYAAAHEAVAETVPGSTSRPFLDDDAIFDQDDDEQFLAFLDRRAAGS